MKAWFSLFALMFIPGCIFLPRSEEAPSAGISSSLTGLPAQESIPESEINAMLSRSNSFSLADLVNLALRNNPRTRQFWFQSQASAAAVGVEKSAYYPQLDLGARTQKSKSPGRDSVSSSGPFASLDVLLFDFGERRARVKVSVASWKAALHTREAAVQDVIFQTQTAYYQYVSLRFLARAQESSRKEAEANLDAAKERSKAGVGTLTDVLQAKTALSKVKLSLQSIEGQLMALRGAVFTSAGLPPSAPLAVAEVSWENWPMQETSEAVAHFLDMAEANHPELLAAMENLERAKNKERETSAARFPKITVSGRAEESRENGVFGTAYSTVIEARLPLFAGGEYFYEHEKAKSELSVEKEKFRELQQTKALAVWSDYYAHETAKQQILTADDLLASAKESLDVTLKRYREGAGSILDLLSAQSALEDARASQIQARADWLLSLAKLRHDAGILDRESSSK